MRITSLEILPVWLALVLAAALMVMLAYGCVILRRKQVSTRWIAALAILRTLAVVLFLLCLIRPVLNLTAATERGPAMLILIDKSQSMALPAGSDGTTRLDAIRAALIDHGLTDALARQFDLHWSAFDRDAHRIGPDALPMIQPDGDQTRIAQSLRTAQRVARQTASGQAASHAILITDGNDADTDGLASELQQLGLTLFALAPPAPAASTDPSVTIAHVQSQRRVLIGSEIRFLTAIRHQHATDIPLIVELLEDGQPVSSAEITFAEDETERSLRFTHKPVTVGDRLYTFQVHPKDKDSTLKIAGEVRTSVQVLDHPHEVLLIEDAWRWEMKYLKRVLEDDPGFSLTGFMMRAPGTFMQFAEPDSAVKHLAGFPQSRAELDWFDVIILGDVIPQRWPSALASAIHDAVVEQGKSLVILAGPNLAHLANEPLLDALLPVDVTPATSRPLTGPIKVQPAVPAADSAFFNAPADQTHSVNFADLPALDYLYPPLRKRPAATILLETTERRNAYGNIIVMAEHPVGRGRVLFIGTDTLWKWQTLAQHDPTGQSPHRLFWQQALRAMAPDRSHIGAVNIYLTTDRTRYRAGQPVSVHAELLTGAPTAIGPLDATVTLPDQRKLPMRLVADPTNVNQYSASFEAASPGAHRIAAVVRHHGQTIAESVISIDVDPPAPESTHHQVNTTLLSHLASATRGHLIDPRNPDTFPSRQPHQVTTVQITRTLDFWHQYYLLGALVIVLGADWLIRLLRGLA